VVAYSVGSWLAQAVPPGVLVPAAERAGVLASRWAPSLGPRRSMVARHLRRAYGPDLDGRSTDGEVDRAFASYARYWAESLRLPGLSFDELDARMSWEGLDNIDDADGAGHGCILALPHLGGWEWAGKWLIGLGFPMTVVVEALDPPELSDWFVSFRRRLGMQIVRLGPGAASAVVRALAANRVVCLLCDRNVGDSPGVEVSFFGERTQLPAGPATLALRTGAALLPTAVYFDGRRSHRAVVQPPVDTARRGGLRDDVVRVTQCLASELESLIKREPTPWHLLQPNWPSDHRSGAGAGGVA
jgi:KDO2-lipid IV(A) lauroyltransferase